ncbi:Sigma non-opioid intracellular receptor 1 like [Heracleum sosnowskyi]|uniref:Sigma non-opioid intracellular receptor 1 like n=1 Tax=Heracleum sosnowskyi TaxID=360622 RepID=A0AAD8ILQ4_9APIA|nr:Sigma non-opioid intracellular receptor 1 like [Heracleum sosnowskyi]
MKSDNSTPESSVYSTTDDEKSEIRDTSCYFPGCRKDANCNCEMCLASINATLDLMPLSVQRSSLTKLSSTPISRTPVPFSPNVLSTPISRISPVRMALSPVMKSNKKLRFEGDVKKKEKREVGFVGVGLKRLFFGFCLVLVLEFGFSWVVSRGLRTELSSDLVRNLGEDSWGLRDLNERFAYLSNGVKGLIGVKNLNGSFVDDTWEINQDGLLLNSYLTLYKSVAEEVRIWGWPLQTAGLLTTTFSSKSYTVLSGRVTEWTNGKAGFVIRRASTSWTQEKWSASVVQLDRNTWILEYKRSSITENAGLLSAVLEFLRFRITRLLQKMNQEFWLFSIQGSHFKGRAESLNVPT